MMMDHPNQKAEKALSALDGMLPAEPKPFLLTRVNALIQKNIQSESGAWSRIAAVLQKPAIAFTALLLIILLNIAVISSNDVFAQKNTVQALGSSTRYDLTTNVSGIYDIENQEP